MRYLKYKKEGGITISTAAGDNHIVVILAALGILFVLFVVIHLISAPAAVGRAPFFRISM